MGPEPFVTRTPPSRRLLIFARIPELGRVKSRLAEELGEERALSVYQAMLRDVLDEVGSSTEELEVEVLWAAEGNVSGALLRRWFGDHQLAMQTGNTLGDRLAVAVSERIFFHATEKVVVIGTDEPTLTRGEILNAFELLESCEWVVGPATDGGYYLIGCRAGAFHSDVFRGIEWGTAAVFESTIDRIRGIGATVATLPVRRDIDRKEDLAAMWRRLSRSGSHLAEVLQGWESMK